MICPRDIEENIFTFHVINDRLGDLRDEMLHLNTNPFVYDFYSVKGHWSRRPGSKELLRVEHMIGDIQSFIKSTIGHLIDEKKQLLSCQV